MNGLEGKRILVVEDEALISMMLADMLEEMGSIVVGPGSTLAAGLSLARSEAIDAAVLDVNLRGERIDPVADVLTARGIPILFASGYGATALQGRNGASFIDKPYTQEKLHSGLTRVLLSEV